MKNELYNFEKNSLGNDNPEKEISKVVGFQSANKNISVSYYLTLKNKDLDLFEYATLSVEPIIYDGPIIDPFTY